MQVIFSQRAMTSMLIEVEDHLKTETGGVFLGTRTERNWYVMESVHPGPLSVFGKTYFEYDKEYINYTINKIAGLYKTQLDLVGIWHRHLGEVDEFSKTDMETNKEYAALSPHGTISGIITLNPDVKLTLYHISSSLFTQKIPFVIKEKKLFHNYRNNFWI